MSNNFDKKFNKRKKKKKKGMSIEDFAKENNLDLDILFDYESSPEKDQKSDTHSNHSNSNDSQKFDNYYLNKKKFNLKNNLQKQHSASTNISTTDDEIKEKDKKESEYVDNKFDMKGKVLNTIRNGVKEFKLNEITYKNENTQNNCYLYQNQKYINKNLFTGMKQYYTNPEENNNTNNKLFYGNRIDKAQANIYMSNYHNIYMSHLNNYLNNITLKIYGYNNILYKLNSNNILQEIKKVEKNIEDIKIQITTVENNTLYDMVLSEQMQQLINYIKKKTNISNLDNNDIKFSTDLKHPYFYTDHNEEIRVKFILNLIEGLFLEEHLIKDYTLIKMLDRDGYASLTKLEKHPQLISFKINIEILRPVFLEHRQNEVTETVETFDDILIRNRNWKYIRKNNSLDAKKIEQNLLNEMGKIKHEKMKNLMGKKSEYQQIQEKLYFQHHVNTQRVKQIQTQMNTINNLYNYQNNTFIFKNNNIYNNYYAINQKRFGY